ncbi:extracellular dihydrogeodin oxidase/laccase-like protein [Pseudovirgaria hyperparasitica]|uniref:Extracellular dihydrogeodin oxidase/laccase-like protein n=1 Tax=Pseudovirgaria hyperparasitica TaxID=470096 RepID=A0A6A6WD52_9PEZI|nr:extracellular dihydrogeodin oxidase/laccase-like protein [Pseudovirgaria hyperparasitica]KAF2760762.1 extracellular dihydrogeodin oxidase/laccase-like protein [Pseudovirgaria hyperparasitica]
MKWSPFVLFTSAAIAIAPQSETNGESDLGTLDLTWRPCVGDNPNSVCNQLLDWAPDRWDDLLHEVKPSKERHYTFDITRGFLSPDGVNSSVIMVNGGFPGPTIEANEGDTFVIEVNNNANVPTSIHWHGLFQKQTPFMDGVPSIGQCPIPPGASFTYRFKADRVGTSWWHSHYQGQTVAGLFGPMIIHGPPLFRYDIDVGPVMLHDRWHIDYEDLNDETLKANPVQSDSNLINGKMDYNCSLVTDGAACFPDAGFSKFRFKSGKTHLLRLINPGADGLQHFTIDDHKLTVVSVDYTPIEPFETDVVSLAPGQRTEVLVKAVGKPSDSYWLRSDIDPSNPQNSDPTASVCGVGSRQPHAKAIVYYEKADCKKYPTTQATKYTTTARCGTFPLDKTVPLIPEAPPTTPETEVTVDMTIMANASGVFIWSLNNHTFRANMNSASLAQSTAPTFKFSDIDPLANIYNLGSNKTARILLYNIFAAPHPMHLHGHDFYVLADGAGVWDGTVTNAANPIRRDTHQLLPSPDGGVTPGYTVIEMVLDNPGIWPLHCHVSQHLTGGMMLEVAYGKSTIETYKVPAAITDVCEEWNLWRMTNVVDQPDSGL